MRGMSSTDTNSSPNNFGKKDTTFQAAGGIDGVRRLVDAFYDLMDADDRFAAIRRLHPADLSGSRDRLARFLTGWMNGPRLYQEKYGSISIPGVHAHLSITETHKDAWLACMQGALDQQPFSAELKTYLIKQLNYPAERIVVVSQQNQATTKE